MRQNVAVDDLIDGLGSEESHLRGMRGELLSPVSDPELEALVVEAAALLEAPIALITLVLRRTQYFRAAYGLPADLSITRSTDRSASFCQLVVRDQAPLMVTDASRDARLPQDLVKRFGIQAYAGVPVRVAGTIVGSLCGIDLVPRAFRPNAIEKLGEIAGRVSERLTELSISPQSNIERITRAAGPAFAEMRNALMTVSAGTFALKRAVMDLEGLTHLTDPALTKTERERVAGALREAPEAIEDLRGMADELQRGYHRIYDSLQGLEALVAHRAEADLQACLTSAERLAAHHTKLVGGIRWDATLLSIRVSAPPAVVVAIATTALSEIALADLNATKGIQISAMEKPGMVQLRYALVESSLQVDYEKVAALLELLTNSEPGISVQAEPGGLSLFLAAQDKRPAEPQS